MRAVCSGILETAGTTFLLLIALREFQAGPGEKSLIASGGSLGLLLSPLVVAYVARARLPVSRGAALLSVFGAAAFLLPVLSPSLHLFVVVSLCTMAASSAGVPLLTQIYQENYPESQRGHFFSRTVMIRIGAAALFSEIGGRMLAWGGGRPLLLIFSAAFLVGGFCLSRCPSTPLIQGEGWHPFKSMQLVREDRVFRHTLICWMLMGFANLMMLPMRIEYLGNPRYGMAMSEKEVAFLVGVLPNTARLVMSPIWGVLFDRVNFFGLRAVLNLGFATSIFAFFTSDTVGGLIAGAIIYGVSNAGGDVAWGLWVTKFAPPGRVAAYMSVHTFFTGVRGVVAPFAAFYLLGRFPVAWIGAGCAAMILISALMLIPEMRMAPRSRKTAALVEEVSE